MPFVSAFAFTGTISWPLIFAVFLFLIMGAKIIQRGALPPHFLGFDLVIIFFFLFIVVFSYFINGWGNSKSLNHTVAYGSTFLLFYVAIKFTFFSAPNKNLLLKRILQFITYTTILSALYGNVEFISSNFFGLNLNDYIPRPSEVEAWYDATVLGLFYRARGFAPESGHYTFMMELFAPLVIYYLYFSGLCKWHKLLKTLSIIIIVLSFIFAVSTASFIIVPLAFICAAVFYAKKIYLYIKRFLRKFVITTFLISTTVILLNYFLSFYTLILLSITSKLDSTSFDDREAKIDFFYSNFSRFGLVKKIFGAGPAGYNILGFDETNSILSLYHNITFEMGFLGIFLILSLLFYLIICALKITDKIGFFLLASLLSGIFHFYFIANFWYPWFWFIATVVIFCSKQNKFIFNNYKVVDII
ncbi:hypothetical protein FW778_06300 [Ginsengibacter hankyongi]|uniref:Uncharacterized protein n=1 Tax=Ginsengibacter hankyongi TaxID=2607284 RepID=A0A5J5IKW3_9BACT|nr:hypothetical protein [Ginsengibacter hankyongi]KAA9041629.1 hypothetical protein FW778_06300 [Ginsengibacter hankyongi]